MFDVLGLAGPAGGRLHWMMGGRSEFEKGNRLGWRRALAACSRRASKNEAQSLISQNIKKPQRRFLLYR